jgi:hypothetical protein
MPTIPIRVLIAGILPGIGIEPRAYRPKRCVASNDRDQHRAFQVDTPRRDAAQQRGLTRSRVEDAVGTLHPTRETNDGEGEWRVDAGTFVVIYNHPDGADAGAVRIISTWVKRRRRRRGRGDYPE